MKTKSDTIRNIGFRLQRILNLRSQLEEKPILFDAEIEITPKEIHTIQAIGEHKSINVKELGDYFGVTKSAASQMIKKLTKKGFVKKINPPNNNKELQLILTKLGKRAFYAHEQFHAAHMNELIENLGNFSVKDIETTADLLKIIEDTVRKRLAEL